MSGIKNLKILLKSVKPELSKKDYVFCSVPEGNLGKMKLNPLLKFKENEGTTLIMTKEEATRNKLRYDNLWSLITLTVHSDLNAVGFLAAITSKLAEKDVSVNAVSAYYHDHIFVPKEKSTQAMKIIKELQSNSN